MNTREKDLKCKVMRWLSLSFMIMMMMMVDLCLYGSFHHAMLHPEH